MPIPKISIRALQAFVAVYEEQSFSRAAERENATQSGMSTQVKTLETNLDTVLLIRDRRSLTLTPAGEILYREGQTILKSLLDAEAAVVEIERTVSGLVRFGMIPSLTRSVLSSAIETVKAEFPRVELALIEEYSFSLMRRVLDGEIEFAVVPSGDIPKGLTARFVGRDREMIVHRAGDTLGLPHLTPAPLAALNGRRLILPGPQNVRCRQIESTLDAHGVRLADRMSMDGMLGTLELVAATDWMAILPSAICHADQSGDRRALHVVRDPPMGFDYVIVEKSEVSLSRAARILADQIVLQTETILSNWADMASTA